MKIVAFDAGTINERGTSVAVFDYADHLERSGLGRAVVLHDENAPGASAGAVARFRARFSLLAKPPEHEMADLLARTNATVLYRLKAGADDGRYVPGVRNVNHVVFRHDEPHGERYAYISEWLAQHMTGGARPWVPHIVSMPEPQKSLRTTWGVPLSATVLGRHGGFDQFNLPFAPRAVARALERRPDLWFVFVNTKRFIDHERVLFLPAIFDPQDKADFIGSCDGMIHARKIGESFGLAMAEFLALDKPVICWRGGGDRHHLSMQPDPDLSFGSAGQLERILVDFHARPSDGSRRTAVADFRPETAMRRFSEVFLEGEDVSLPTMPNVVRVRRYWGTRYAKSLGELYVARSKIEALFGLA